MALSLLNNFKQAFRKFEYNLLVLITGRHPPGELCLANDVDNNSRIGKGFSIKDILGDGFLWAVPKSRRTIEKRWKRKFGDPYYHWKLYKPKKNLVTCSTCGYHHEIGILCGNCYSKIMDETKMMQEEIQNELKLEPVEKEVVVLYENEKQLRPAEFWEGKRIVEIQKPRPQWFSKNLLQKTTQAPAESKDVKPSDLG